MLDAVAALAREAGREIFAIWKTGFATDTKLDGSPVTIADQRAEAIILAGLQRIAPHTPVIAEEEVAAGRIPEIGDRYFLVDPLDGTKGFSEGGKEDFTVNIGLIEGGVPTLGVVYAPASGRLWAGDAQGAWLGQCDPATAEETAQRRSIRVSARTGAWRVIGSRTYSNEQFRAFATRVGAAETVAASSSLKFCLVACDEADLYPRFGPLMDWDVAAGHAVLRAAGGNVMMLDGAPVPYARRDRNFELKGLIAYGGAASEQAARATLG